MKYLNKETEIEIPATGSWEKTKHVFDEESIWAVNASLASRRPLLIKGEPGTGKSQLARAAAFVLKRGFLSEVVYSGLECHDLQFRFDAVARLGKAQILGAKAGCDDMLDIDRELDPINFLTPGPLWWTFDWVSAKKHIKDNKIDAKIPEVSDDFNPDNGSVLLIDEIDKADADLPNGLLETLGNGGFKVPYLDKPVKFSGRNIPLVVVTTNGERELPAAFVRRCMVLELKLDKDKLKLSKWLIKRGRVHFKDRCDDAVIARAAKLLVNDREVAIQEGITPPGQAEYLDLLRAVSNLSDTGNDPAEVLEFISKFALKKHSSGQV